MRVTTGYTENELTWDQEHGTLTTTHRGRPGDAITFRRHWGIDRSLALPAGLPAWAANRYIDALDAHTRELVEHATKEYNHQADAWHIVYSQGHQPYMDALNNVINHVFPGEYGSDDLQWEAEREFRDYGTRHTTDALQERIDARARAMRVNLIRSLIVDGDASYTPAAPGHRYTIIRLDMTTGHLSAHTSSAPGDNVQEWEVSALNARQANKVMKSIGADALRMANPDAPGVIAADARERLDETMRSLLIGDDKITTHLDQAGQKDTPARRNKALRTLTNTRVNDL